MCLEWKNKKKKHVINNKFCIDIELTQIKYSRNYNKMLVIEAN